LEKKVGRAVWCDDFEVRDRVSRELSVGGLELFAKVAIGII